MVCMAYAGYTFGRFVENGMGNLFVIKTYERGTNLYAYFKIRVFGADPKAGIVGSSVPKSKEEYSKHSQGKYFVFNDHSDITALDVYSKGPVCPTTPGEPFIDAKKRTLLSRSPIESWNKSISIFNTF